MKETRHERVHIVLFPLHKILEQNYSILIFAVVWIPQISPKFASKVSAEISFTSMRD